MRLAVSLAMIAVSLLVGLRGVSGEENRPPKQSRPQLDAQQSRDAEREAIFDEVMKSGAARIFCETVPHSKHSWGLDIQAGCNEWLKAFCNPVHLLCPPRPPRWTDLLDIAVFVSTEAIQPQIGQLDEALFGRDATYEAILWDSPSLPKNLELLSRLPELSTLSVYTNRKDEELLPLIRKIHVTAAALHDLAELGRHDASVSGVVVDPRGTPVPGGWVTINTRSGRHVCALGLNDAGEFRANSLPRVPYRIKACGFPSSLSWFDSWLGDGVEATASAPVDAKPGDKNVRIVLDVAAVPKKPRR